ncbi:capsular associated protein, partial [Borealophlyctis nickersoniae]
IRNKAIAPLLHLWEVDTGNKRNGTREIAERWNRIVFMNDVLFCAEDILELLHQSVAQEADITCGLDYNWPTWDRNTEPAPGFYDTWIARNLAGKPFEKYPWNGFTDDVKADERIRQNLPFQAQCCWNGGAILRPDPILENDIQFRAGRPGECAASECTHICNDFARAGWNRVLVVPSVRYAYEEDVHAAVVRRMDGTDVPQFQPERGPRLLEAERVVWADTPRMVRCHGLSGNGRDPTDAWVDEEVVTGTRPRAVC